MQIAARSVLVGIAALLAAGCVAPASDTSNVLPNDNTHPVGTLRSGVLTAALETRIGAWRPDGPGGRTLDSIAAFAEVGRAATTPGPLIRVPVGTVVHGTLHNTLARPLTVFGLGPTHALADSLVIPRGATAPFTFRADKPGTFLYTARTRVDTALGRDPTDMQLNGVIVVDAPNAPPDRIMAITWYFTINPKSSNGVGDGVMTINGLSWPHTERLNYTQGDSVRWRVVNLTEGDHPMHLHGFYFRVDSRSGNGIDTVYAPDQQRMAVTETINPYTAVDLAWQADRPGNWIFHCHYSVHLSNFVTLDTHNGYFDSTAMEHHPSDRPHQMYGLVMGLTVAPRGPQPVAAAPERRIRLEQREQPNLYGTQTGLSYVLTDNTTTPAPAMSIPGPTLVLERGKQVQITVVNASDQHAAVHWHGIELASSYPDGVPGWSGAGAQMYPPIAPHDSLTVAWTPPRAGSFMYHSHFNETHQIGGGLYGPIIVLEPGEKFDADKDRLLFFGTAGTVLNFGDPTPPAVLLNGQAHPGPMEFKTGTHYRLRLFNLAGDNPTVVTLGDGGKPVEWRALAKDGYPLPASQAVVQPATVTFDPGEIYDFEFTPSHSGNYTLAFGLPQPPTPPPSKDGAPPPPSTVPHPVNVTLHVR